MKKYFIFAAVATAGLFASCSSSDDITANEGQNPIENSEARQAIRLNLATPGSMTTRGTGTVGGVGTSNDANYIPNAWAGQSINVFMFTKDENHATTLNLTEADNSTAQTPVYMYDDLEMITPGSAENLIPGMGADANTNDGEAMIADGTINYYPPAGNFDFFGYHGDGVTGAVVKNGSAAVYYTEDEINAAAAAYTTDNVGQMSEQDAATWMTNHPAYNKTTADVKTAATDATLWTVPFTITGSEDLMSTKAELTTTQVGLMPTSGNRVNDYYSAYAARKGVHPTLTFNHLLTRLQFSVKAGNDAAAGYEASTPAVYYTQAECDEYNATLTGHKTAGEMTNIYSFTSFVGETDQAPYYQGKAEILSESEGYTTVKVIANSVASFIGNEYVVHEVISNLANAGTLELLTPDTRQSLDPKIFVKTFANVALTEAEANAYNATLNGARSTADVKTPATGGLTAENAVFIKSIQVLSANTKGNLAVAWTADAASMQDYQKITWDAQQPEEDTRWLTLKERPYAYKFKTGAAAATYTDLAAYADKDNDWYTGLDTESNPTKATVDDAVATLTANITNAVYQTLSVAGRNKYEVDPAVNADNETLVPLTATAPDIDTDANAATRYPTKRVGEAIILSPGAYQAPTTANDNAAVPTTTTASLKMKVKVAQNVPTNWNTPTVRTEKVQDLDLVITAPDGGFKQNTSYNIILTVYGLERIEVIAVVQPWANGGEIEVGQD